MAWDVCIFVVFPCDYNEQPANLAREQLKNSDSFCREAIDFLTEISNRVGRNDGYKGGLSLWGYVGNYTNVNLFVHDLEQFWTLLLKDMCSFPHERILIFGEVEQSDSMSSWEVSLNSEGNLLIKTFDNLPFSIGQY